MLDKETQAQAMAMLDAQEGQTEPVQTGEVAPDDMGGQTAPAADGSTEVQPEAQPQEQPMLLGKFKTVDDLENAYQASQGKLTQLGQEKAEMAKMLSELTALSETLKGQADINELPIEDDGIDENVKAYLDSKFGPLIQQSEQRRQEMVLQQGLSALRDAHPDVDNYVDQIIEDVLGYDDSFKFHPKAFEMAYNARKAGSLKAPDELLGEDSFIEQAAGNDKVKEKVISDYLQSVKKANNAPPTIGVKASGEVALTPKDEPPKTLRQSREGARKYLDSLGG